MSIAKDKIMIRVVSGVVGFRRNLKPGDVIEVEAEDRAQASYLVGIRSAEYVDAESTAKPRRKTSKAKTSKTGDVDGKYDGGEGGEESF